MRARLLQASPGVAMLVCLRYQAAGTLELPAFCRFRCYFQRNVLLFGKIKNKRLCYTLKKLLLRGLVSSDGPRWEFMFLARAFLGANPQPCLICSGNPPLGGKNGCMVSSRALGASAVGPARHLFVLERRRSRPWRDGHLKPFLSMMPNLPRVLF